MSEGTDELFPSIEQKDTASTFELELPFDCKIEAPYGQCIFGKSISLSVPDDHRLVFKRRCRFSVASDSMSDITQNEYIYIIAFEKKAN